MSISFSHAVKTVPEKADVCPIGRGTTRFFLFERKNLRIIKKQFRKSRAFVL